MTGSQKRRARKAGRKALRAAEIQQMKEAQKDGVGVGKFEPEAPERTGARKRRRKVLFGGLGERQRRGYLVAPTPLPAGVEFDTYGSDMLGRGARAA